MKSLAGSASIQLQFPRCPECVCQPGGPVFFKSLVEAKLVSLIRGEVGHDVLSKFCSAVEPVIVVGFSAAHIVQHLAELAADLSRQSVSDLVAGRDLDVELATNVFE